EGETIQRMQRLLVICHLGDFRRGEFRGACGLWLFGGEPGGHQGKASQRDVQEFSRHGSLYYETLSGQESCAPKSSPRTNDLFMCQDGSKWLNRLIKRLS